ESVLHVSCNPVGPDTLDWIRRLCFREQSEEEFYGPTIAVARQRQTRVTFDPPCLTGDPLEIESCRAAFRDLELTTERLDLLAAVLEAMARRHRQALADLGQGERFRRVFLTGEGADVVRRLIPEYQAEHIELVQEGPLRGVARLFTN